MCEAVSRGAVSIGSPRDLNLLYLATMARDAKVHCTGGSDLS